jgi:hypothetical protein
MPYFSKFYKQSPQFTEALDDALQSICDYVHQLSKIWPEKYKDVKLFADVLPLNHNPTAYPFASFVINIQALTDPHKDSLDLEPCVVIPFGKWEQGDLVLFEPGIVLELQLGDVLFFPSCFFTHFNLPYAGTRCSLVMFTDKHGLDWVRYRNGWEKHMVVNADSDTDSNSE